MVLGIRVSIKAYQKNSLSKEQNLCSRWRSNFLVELLQSPGQGRLTLSHAKKIRGIINPLMTYCSFLFTSSCTKSCASYHFECMLGKVERYDFFSINYTTFHIHQKEIQENSLIFRVTHFVLNEIRVIHTLTQEISESNRQREMSVAEGHASFLLLGQNTKDSFQRCYLGSQFQWLV